LIISIIGLTVFYRKRKIDGDKAIFVLSAMQLTLIVDIVMGIMILNKVGHKVFQAYSTHFAIGLLFLAIVFIRINFKRYKGKYYSFKQKWIEETNQQKSERFLLLIVSVVIIVFFIPMVAIINP